MDDDIDKNDRIHETKYPSEEMFTGPGWTCTDPNKYQPSELNIEIKGIHKFQKEMQKILNDKKKTDPNIEKKKFVYSNFSSIYKIPNVTATAKAAIIYDSDCEIIE